MNTTISFRSDEAKKRKLDKVAIIQDRNRSYIINQAIDYYLDAHLEKVRRIKSAQQQVKDGNVHSEKKWRQVFQK